MQTITNTLGDGVEIKIIKTKPSVTFAQSHWNLLDNDLQWILEPKNKKEILEYEQRNNNCNTNI